MTATRQICLATYLDDMLAEVALIDSSREAEAREILTADLPETD